MQWITWIWRAPLLVLLLSGAMVTASGCQFAAGAAAGAAATEAIEEGDDD